MTIEELERNLSDAQSELAALTQEKNALPAMLQKAGRDGDGVKLLELRRRNDELPSHIFAAQVATMRAEMAVLDATLARSQPEQQALRTESEQAAERAKQAQAELVAAQNRAGRHEQRIKLNRERRSSLQRQIEDLVSEQTAPLGTPLRMALRTKKVS